MKEKKRLICFSFTVSLILAVTAWAMTPEELQYELDQGVKLTIIDTRGQSAYANGHIPDAINIPANIVQVKKLPPIGKVVVYGDAIHVYHTREALLALNGKKGINARMLKGGFGAWEASKLQTTVKTGMSKKRWHYLTYQELKQAALNNSDIILVDIRNRNSVLTDLRKEFSLQEIIELTNSNGQWDISPCLKNQNNQKLFVLIDEGDGESGKVASLLTLAGIKRVSMLAGGESSIVRRGKAEKITKVTREALQ